MTILPCTQGQAAFLTGTLNVPEPFEADYGAITDHLLEQIDRDTNQQELAGGQVGQAFAW